MNRAILYAFLLFLSLTFLLPLTSFSQVKRIHVNTVATCYTYNSTAGKGKGYSIKVQLIDSRFYTNYFKVDRLIIGGQPVAFLQSYFKKYSQLEYNYFESKSDPIDMSSSTSDSSSKTNTNFLFEKDSLYPSKILFHHGKRTYEFLITNYKIVVQ